MANYLPAIDLSDGDYELGLTIFETYHMIPNVNNYRNARRSNRNYGYTEIVELIRFEHLNEQEKKNIINLISNSQDRFHIPEEKLTAINVLQHQIPTTDDRPINTRQYRFPQLHKEEINKQVE
ncbi:hypothetical protein ALC56_00323 [Trachymyrmex septentrionalis]|uniref:Uncharacterized protein n=1 Tax=Trachymyrmex septentrionalis TaxID=34720 RepID=A0A151K191_9HYME|nr:hypothetical protein ALC56_00323 [Trachymyrmex septentrionalis]